MRYLKTKTFIWATPVVLLGFFLIASCATGQRATGLMPPPGQPGFKPGPEDARVAPGPNDPRIAYVTARLLEQYDFTQRRLDTELAKRFFDGYVDSLDARHENFLQSDLQSFSWYRTNLDKLTTGGTEGEADISPALAIYKCFVKRLQQHNDYVMNLLKQDHFKFNSDERIAIDRRHAPYPKDLAEAQKLWEQQIKFEYLQEKLADEITPTNNAINRLTKEQMTEITTNLISRYQRNLRLFTNWESSDVLQAYLNGLAHAYDPHSDYFGPEHAQDFSMQMNLSLFGIGAQLMDPDGYCTISKLMPGGPAIKSKELSVNDRIIAVAQGTNPPVNVVDMELGKVVQQIRGVKGTEVRLTISPAEDRTTRKVVSLIRDEIKIEDSEAKARLIEIPYAKGEANRIGVIDLPSFYAPVDLGGDSGSHATPKYASADVAKLVKWLKAQDVKSIILDFRNNPGGSLEEAVKLTGMFIKEGPVVQSKYADGTVKLNSDNDSDMLYQGPLAIMINRFSASASEITAAALQDYDRALVVGDSKSFGKGTVQNLNKLRPFVWPKTPSATNDPGAVKITICKFYRITGASTEFNGVASDLVLPDPLDYRSDIESESTLENSLPTDTIPGATFAKYNMAQRFVEPLRIKSQARVATNQDFAYIQQDITEFKRLSADKSFPLNEAEAIKERQTIQARQKARDAEHASRAQPDLKVYEISLADADSPTLPTPSYAVGYMETNFSTSTTITLKPAYAVTGAAGTSNRYATFQFSAEDLKAARGVGIQLPTEAKYPVADASRTNFTEVAQALIKEYPLENGEISSNNGTLIVKKYKLQPKQPDLDPLLRETCNIMQDYVKLLGGYQAVPLAQN